MYYVHEREINIYLKQTGLFFFVEKTYYANLYNKRN